MPFPLVGLPPPGEPGLPQRWPEDEWWPGEVAGLEEPTEADLAGLCPDPFAGPPDGEDAWLGDLSLAELDALADQWTAGEGRVPPRDGVGAGFGRDLPGDPAAGFAAGGPLDGLAPGPVLAGFAARSPTAPAPAPAPPRRGATASGPSRPSFGIAAGRENR